MKRPKAKTSTAYRVLNGLYQIGYIKHSIPNAKSGVSQTLTREKSVQWFYSVDPLAGNFHGQPAYLFWKQFKRYKESNKYLSKLYSRPDI